MTVSIENIGKKSVSIPPIHITMRDTKRVVVYSTIVTADRDLLEPREEALIEFNRTDVPINAETVTLEFVRNIMGNPR